ncbi:MAG TPA: LysM peptidoglycan-binding domain-containing protein [Opitutaceae bacterium]|nr:LysM peptidoglycan-binding domain-containing protein [Opitutaceae bacterium]
MNFSPRPFRLVVRVATLAAAAGLFATFSNAQSLAVEVANLREDVRMLSQRVGELSLNVEQLQRENQSLRNQASAGNQAFATLAQLNSAIAELKRTNTAAIAEQKRETISQVSQQIDQLAKQTQAAIDALARGSTPSSAGKTLVFTDDFSKEAVAMHTVATGETLSSIAKKYNASIRDIQNANKIADPTRIQVGQTLFIPKPKP